MAEKEERDARRYIPEDSRRGDTRVPTDDRGDHTDPRTDDDTRTDARVTNETGIDTTRTTRRRRDDNYREIPNTGGNYPAVVTQDVVTVVETDLNTGLSTTQLQETITPMEVVEWQPEPAGEKAILDRNSNINVLPEGELETKPIEDSEAHTILPRGGNSQKREVAEADLSALDGYPSKVRHTVVSRVRTDLDTGLATSELLREITPLEVTETQGTPADAKDIIGRNLEIGVKGDGKLTTTVVDKRDLHNVELPKKHTVAPKPQSVNGHDFGGKKKMDGDQNGSTVQRYQVVRSVSRCPMTHRKLWCRCRLRWWRPLLV